MQIVIQVSGQPDVVIGVTDAAMKRARVSFNPSNAPHVDNIKALAAAFYTELDGMIASRHPVAGREAATAATHIQAGAMFAVSAATAE